MPSNPLQRKARNSFLLGMLITLLVMILIGGAIFLLVLKPKLDKQKEEEAGEIVVYQLTANVKSGQDISVGVPQAVTLPSSNVPVDALTVLPDEGSMAKIDLTQGTILSSKMIAKDESELDESSRIVEYNMITLPVMLQEGDYIDVRISFPNGQDLIIVSNKVVQGIQENVISLCMSEGEILMMNSAIIENAIMPSSKLFITKNVEPGRQSATKTTYTPTSAVQDLIRNNPNIVNDAKKALTDRFADNVRDYIDNQVGQYSGDALLNIESSVQKQIEEARTARENYLSGMAGY